MPALEHVAIHSTVFPENVQRELLRCLRDRRIDPKFHYTSYKQSQKWLALHEAHSPARTDADCAAIYERGFEAAAAAVKGSEIHLIGLGCGGGQKDATFLRKLKGQGRKISYAPCDISLPLVITSSQAAQAVAPGLSCHPLVCDIGTAEDLAAVFENQNAKGIRVLTFFGMIPNFEPEVIMLRLAALVQPGDLMLFSANLAPGPDYAAGVQHVLPGYDNTLTRDWLLTFLYDLGVEPSDGSITFSIEDAPLELKRIVADFSFAQPCRFTIYGEQFEFKEGDALRLFFSYRYTPRKAAELLARHNFSVLGEWITGSGEEGVFLCGRKGP